MEWPADTYFNSVRQTDEKAVVIATPASETASVGGEGYTWNDGKINFIEGWRLRSLIFVIVNVYGPRFEDVEGSHGEVVIGTVRAQFEFVPYDYREKDMFAFGCGLTYEGVGVDFVRQGMVEKD